MSELSRAQQDKARAHLAELEAAVDELALAGMDVRLMRGTIALVKAELGEEPGGRAEVIEAWLRGQQEGAVVRYQARFSAEGKVYTYAAVKVGLTWFSSGTSAKPAYTSPALARWMANECVLIDCVRMYAEPTRSSRPVPGVRPDVTMEGR